MGYVLILTKGASALRIASICLSTPAPSRARSGILLSLVENVCQGNFDSVAFEFCHILLEVPHCCSFPPRWAAEGAQWEEQGAGGCPGPECGHSGTAGPWPGTEILWFPCPLQGALSSHWSVSGSVPIWARGDVCMSLGCVCTKTFQVKGGVLAKLNDRWAGAFVSVHMDCSIPAETCCKVTLNQTPKIQTKILTRVLFFPLPSHTLAEFCLCYAQKSLGCRMNHLSWVIQQNSNFETGAKTSVLRFFPQWKDGSHCFREAYQCFVVIPWGQRQCSLSMIQDYWLWFLYWCVCSLLVYSVTPFI